MYKLTIFFALFFVFSNINFGNAQSFSSSKLPIVVLNTEGDTIISDPKIRAHMGIIDNGPGVENKLTDPFNNYNGDVGIEIRGSSSKLFPKKQYGIELWDVDGNGIDASLLGLPEEEDWILFAPYNDKSLMRDVLAYKLGREMGRYAPRTKYFELVLNGNYEGVYVLIEKIKRNKKRLNIDKLKPEEIGGDDVTGGYILKVDKKTGGSGEGWESEHRPLHGNNNQKIFFQLQDPKPEEVVKEQLLYIQQYMKDFEDALAGENFKDPETGYAKYIDVPSFIDFFIANEVTKNVDAYRISTFLHKQNINDGNKLVMGPIWDFNLGFGNADYCTNGNPEGFVMNFNEFCPEDYWLVPFWWERLMEDENFQNQLRTRWVELRQGPFQTNNILTYVDSVATVLDEGPQQRNFKKWPVLGQYVWPNYYVGQSYQDEVNWMKTWITQRMDWLDNNIPGTVIDPGTGPVTGIEDGEKLNDFNFSLRPVPFQEFLTLQYTIPKSGTVKFQWYDLQGRKISEGEYYHQTAGIHQHEINTSQFAKGVYLIKFQFENGPAFNSKVIKN